MDIARIAFSYRLAQLDEIALGCSGCPLFKGIGLKELANIEHESRSVEDSLSMSRLAVRSYALTLLIAGDWAPFFQVT